MLYKHAHIETIVKTNKKGKRKSSYRWVGLSAFTMVSDECLELLGYSTDDKRIDIGPYGLEKVSHYPHMEATKYVRENKRMM